MLRRVGPLTEPVSVARALARRGLGLRKAHEVVNRLVEGQRVPVRLPEDTGPDELARELAAFGVEAMVGQPLELMDVLAER